MYGLLDELFDAGFGLFEQLSRLLLLHQTFAHQIANGFLLVDVEQRNNKTINVGRIEFGLGAASRMLLCLKLPDDGLEDQRHVSRINTRFQSEDVDVIACHSGSTAQVHISPSYVRAGRVDQQIVLLDVRFKGSRKRSCTSFFQSFIVNVLRPKVLTIDDIHLAATRINGLKATPVNGSDVSDSCRWKGQDVIN